MLRLLLLRHAKTERAETGQRDRDRKLTARGRADAPMMGAYMTRHRLAPDLALVSPSVRTMETWDLVAGALSKPPRMQKEERIYNARDDALLELIGEADAARTLLVIGHNPGMHDVAMRLIGSGNLEARESLNEKLPTSGLVVIDFPLEAWSEMHEDAGRLDRFVTPRSLAAASE